MTRPVVVPFGATLADAVARCTDDELRAWIVWARQMSARSSARADELARILRERRRARVEAYIEERGLRDIVRTASSVADPGCLPV